MREKEFLAKIITENIEQKETIRNRVLKSQEGGRKIFLRRKSLVFGVAMVCLLIIFMHQSDRGNKQIADVNTDYPYYEDLESMILHADTIIEGKILSAEVKPPDDSNDIADKLPYTIYDVEIIKAFKGDVKEKEILQIKQLGGGSKDIVVSSKKANLEKDSAYLLFLVSYDDSPASLINPVQGSYLIDGDRYINHINNEVEIDWGIFDQNCSENK